MIFGKFVLFCILFFPSTVPSAPPRDLTLNPQDPRTLNLTWQPPPEDDRNGIITGYVVNITGQTVQEQYFYQTPNTSLVVESLHPYYSYVCGVAAETTAGRGPFIFKVVQLPEDSKSIKP